MSSFQETKEEINNEEELDALFQDSPKKTDAFDLDTDEELSELDEEQFKDLRDSQAEKTHINEYTVHDLPRFKRKSRNLEKTVKPKKIKSIKRRRRGIDTLSEENNESKHDMDPEEIARWELDQALNEAIMSSRRKKRKEDVDLEEMADDEIIALREKMRQAAIEDVQANAEKKPAIQKLKMLSEVENALRKTSFTESILDNNLLEVVRIWLEPLPDRSLPALNIQKVLFSALSRLPIQTEHLRESGVGKVVLFYKQSKKPDLLIKKQADQLICKNTYIFIIPSNYLAEWSRPIIKRSSNYRDRSISTVLYNPDNVTYNEQKKSSNINDFKQIYKKTIIPAPIDSSYEIAPKVHLKVNPIASKTRNDDHIRKLKQKMQKMKQLGKRNGISIEGRRLI
ncbi:hypothetical protein PORY_001753 [Pneumocystis oryctolagi]|uniref:Uncharacterized protein n=1 Tax=Pneumocystis oryctolagi TaxID=42067 RepID=A0ACB7CB48_9ASCO|nr:hypothetical protein PORY_001753 [Pneumocystis oryctolagi]